MGYTERPRRIVGPAQPGPVVRPGPAPGPAPWQGPAARPGTAPPNPAAGAAARPPSAAVGPERYAPRSRKLLDAVGRLDAGLDERACGALADWVREEYATSYGAVPLGFVARCYLGPPYVDHQLNLFHVIVRHFPPAEPMPEPFSAARMLARSGGYACVEVYEDGLLLPVLDDGTVVRP
ncbi:hypothetical protein AQJ66_12565 [Streptomyces bungoensis]|uniref:Uncharacterized protein n=1 Tax=Streptomyces bungoensis TaxID=285568 RepID=A0A117RE45_9ACTN|nr:hypothetical protein [Streptomyces bungoensis]KUN85783.1 hypothetical protein AQJ66_12565 [Streptomyces bungoensis]